MEKYNSYESLSLEEKKVSLSDYYKRLQQAILELPFNDLQKALDMIEDAYKNHKKFFIIGNGGSHATASHFVADMTKTIFGKSPIEGIKRHPFVVECLSDNVPTLTAVGNDLPNGYNEIFSLPLYAKASEGDLLLVITGSGNSGNIVRALEVAKEMNLQTIWFLWFDGWAAKDMVDHSVIVDSKDYGIIEDMHSSYMHAITDYFKKSIK